jgi:hypothetical protein
MPIIEKYNKIFILLYIIINFVKAKLISAFYNKNSVY